MLRLAVIPAVFFVLAGCANKAVDRGQALFFNETFAGNGRTCATCHTPEENFSISPEAIAVLPASHPLFVPVPGLEDPAKLREDALIKITETEFRQTPKLTHLRTICNRKGECVTLGLRGDRAKNLCVFTNQAIANHLTKRVGGSPGKDFRLLTAKECKDMTAYLISQRVAGVQK